MVYKRSTADKRCDEVFAFITEYIAQNGYSPTFREVGEAVGIRSASTISRYIHMLVDAGRISIDHSKPRTIAAASDNDGTLEIVHQRVCLELADGGKIYMDCCLQKPKTAAVRVSFDGVLDAKDMKGRIGRIVSCNATLD